MAHPDAQDHVPLLCLSPLIYKTGTRAAFSWVSARTAGLQTPRRKPGARGHCSKWQLLARRHRAVYSPTMSGFKRHVTSCARPPTYFFQVETGFRQVVPLTQGNSEEWR